MAREILVGVWSVSTQAGEMNYLLFVPLKSLAKHTVGTTVPSRPTKQHVRVSLRKLIQNRTFAMLFYFLSSLFHQTSNLLALSLSRLFFSALRCWEISMLYNIQTSRKAAVCWRRESERSDDKAQRRSRRKEKFILENSPVHTIFFLLLYYFSSQRALESIFCYFVPCCGASVVPDELWTIVNSLHESQLCSLFPRVISLLIFAMGTRARVILFHWIGQSVFYIRNSHML